MDNAQILDFLQQLQNNNTLEWMHQNKPSYQLAKANFESFLQELIVEISKFDSSVVGLAPKSLVFRLNRDTRFSHDKSPYQPVFRAHISSAGRVPIPVGYYLYIKPGASFLGGGVFISQFPQATQMVRNHLLHTSDEFLSILSDKDFKQNFTVLGEKLKAVPKGYDANHPLAEYFKHKSWYIEYPISDDALKKTALYRKWRIPFRLCSHSMLI